MTESACFNWFKVLSATIFSLLLSIAFEPAFANPLILYKKQDWNLVTKPGQQLRLQLPIQNCSFIDTSDNKLHVQIEVWGDAQNSEQKRRLLKEAMVSVLQSGQVITIKSSHNFNETIFSKHIDIDEMPRFLHALWESIFHGDSRTLPMVWQTPEVMAKLRVELPAYLPIDAQLGTGNFHFLNPGAKNSLVVKNGTGLILIDTASPEIRIHSGTGMVQVQQSDGVKTVIHTGTGSVHWQGSSQSLEIASGTGNVQIQAASLPREARLRATTGTGDLDVCFKHKTALDGTINAGLGGFDLKYPIAPTFVHGSQYQFGPTANAVKIHFRSGTGKIRLRTCP
ncbi:DUF4097 family beta strand repeat-containing protein [Acidithiobacillus sp. M4-SHS-6]|uniref:DUF4097 family beta strand repeat-containing protein n=1 Tax=Acidithiobacillus sp. M4-SHS-6 TaxID=3383024 RepID=UPI0039BE681C